MVPDNAKNFAKVTVSTGYNSAATSIVLSSGGGAKLPIPPFNVVWWNSTDYADPSDDPNVEVVRVTGISTDTLTVVRAQEGTSASSKNTGGKTYLMIAGLTARTVNNFGGQVIFMPATWPASIGKLSTSGGSLTTGVKMVVTAPGQSIAGFRIAWATTGGAKTVKITLWDLGSGNTGGSSLGTATGSVNSTGLYEILFSSPISVTQWNFYTLAMWENSGAAYTQVSNNTDVPNAGGVLLTRFPYPDGPAVIVQTNLYDSGDAQPTSGAGNPMTVEPIFSS